PKEGEPKTRSPPDLVLLGLGGILVGRSSVSRRVGGAGCRPHLCPVLLFSAAFPLVLLALPGRTRRDRPAQVLLDIPPLLCGILAELSHWLGSCHHPGCAGLL